MISIQINNFGAIVLNTAFHSLNILSIYNKTIRFGLSQHFISIRKKKLQKEAF